MVVIMLDGEHIECKEIEICNDLVWMYLDNRIGVEIKEVDKIVTK